MIAGTLQPKPTSIGTILRPESPTRRKSLSIKKATRAMYPLSSSRDRNRYNTTTIGTKDSTEPTPVKTPSMISE